MFILARVPSLGVVHPSSAFSFIFSNLAFVVHPSLSSSSRTQPSSNPENPNLHHAAIYLTVATLRAQDCNQVRRCVSQLAILLAVLLAVLVVVLLASLCRGSTRLSLSRFCSPLSVAVLLASLSWFCLSCCSKGILADILKSLRDNKKHMRECALNTLDLWLAAVHLDKMVCFNCFSTYVSAVASTADSAVPSVVSSPTGEVDLEDDNIAYFIRKVMKVSRLALLPANPDILEGVDDLIQLSYLNEPSVLYNLKSRYTQDLIYSKAGPVLIALNPFKDVQIYRSEYVEAYKQRCNDNPHVYAVADAAYNEMIRDEVNQSIIISGEMHQKKQEQMHQKEQGQQQQEYQFQQQHQSLEPEPVMIILGFIILAIKAGNLQFPSQALSLSQCNWFE
ncbi:uncharacterized protein DS421_20g695370 [Arachis hypogaea]|nr:uncharacterized protein DS421_20g695370 [Arachis hypogaea]